MQGNHVHLDAVQLAHPAKVMPPISLGVRGPRSMALSAEVGAGVIFAEWSGPRYLEKSVPRSATRQSSLRSCKPAQMCRRSRR